MQWLVASRQPPHLAAIVPWEAFDDQLRGAAYHGGVPCDFMRTWFDTQVAPVQNGLGPRGYRNEFTGQLVSGDQALSDEELTDRHETTDIYRQSMQQPEPRRVRRATSSQRTRHDDRASGGRGRSAGWYADRRDRRRPGRPRAARQLHARR